MATPFLHHYCSFMDSPAETVATADSLLSRVICETLLKQCWVHGRGPALAAAWHDVVRRGAAVRRTGMMVGRGLGRYGWPHDGCVSLISCHHS